MYCTVYHTLHKVRIVYHIPSKGVRNLLCFCRSLLPPNPCPAPHRPYSRCDGGTAAYGGVEKIWRMVERFAYVLLGFSKQFSIPRYEADLRQLL